MTVITLISIILVLIPISDWTAVYILHWASRRAGNEPHIALRERARMAIVLASATTINGCLGAMALLGIPISESTLVTLLTVSFFLVGIPNLYWLLLYYRHRL